MNQFNHRQKVLQETSPLKDRIRQLEADLAMVDEALARRPALAGKATRFEKIHLACAEAGKADALKADLAAANKELNELTGLLQEVLKILRGNKVVHSSLPKEVLQASEEAREEIGRLKALLEEGKCEDK